MSAEFVKDGMSPFKLHAMWDATACEIEAINFFNTALVTHINVTRAPDDKVSLETLPAMPVYERDYARRKGIANAADWPYTLLPENNGVKLGAEKLSGVLKHAAKRHFMSNDPIRPALNMLVDPRLQENHA